MLLIFVPLIFRAEHANDPDPGQHLRAEELKRQAGERAGKTARGVQQGERRCPKTPNKTGALSL